MDASLVVALAAMAVVAGAFVRQGVISLRGVYTDDPDRSRREGRAHMAVIGGAAVVVALANPWGLVSAFVVVAFVAVCQFLFLHAMLIAGFARQRRARADGTAQ